MQGRDNSNKSSRWSLRLLGSLGSWCMRRHGSLGLSILQKGRLKEGSGGMWSLLDKGLLGEGARFLSEVHNVFMLQREILMDIWEKNQTTLECVPESLWNCWVFRTQGGQALDLTLNCSGCWTGCRSPFQSKLLCNTLTLFLRWFNRDFHLHLSVTRLSGKTQQWKDDQSSSA